MKIKGFVSNRVRRNHQFVIVVTMHLTVILSQDEVYPLQRKLALGRDASGSADSDDGRTALGAAMQEANAILATPLLSPTSLATLVDKSEDILVAPGDCRGLMQLVANSFPVDNVPAWLSGIWPAATGGLGNTVCGLRLSQ